MLKAILDDKSCNLPFLIEIIVIDGFEGRG